MKRVQESGAAKTIAALVMLVLVFFSGLHGCLLVETLPYVLSGGGLQNNSQTYRAIRNRMDKVAELVTERWNFEVLGARFAEGEDVSYALERQALKVQELTQALSAEDTNFRYVVLDQTGAVWESNLPGAQLEDVTNYVLEGVMEVGRYYTDSYNWDAWNQGTQSETDDPSTENPEPWGEVTDGNLMTMTDIVLSQEGTLLMVRAGVSQDLSQVEDEFYRIESDFVYYTGVFKERLIGALLPMALAGAWLLFLLWACGHKAGVEGIAIGWQEKTFFDLYLIFMAAVVILGGVLLIEFIHDVYIDLINYNRYSLNTGMTQEEIELYLSLARYGIAAGVTVIFTAMALTLRTFVVRLKAHIFLRTTLLCRVAGWTVRTVRYFLVNLPLFWKAALACGAYFLYTFWMIVVMAYRDGFFLLIWLFISCIVCLLVAWWTISFQKLRKGSKAIVGGDLNHQIPTAHFPADLKAHAEDLNNISGGLQTAVDQQMKSERFKAELITNVSHDLKTPLTSIINYVDLLKTTDQTDPKAREYIEVLDRKAQRLKKLTEDLVEASKASTGTLSVTREKLGMVQLLDQALGEYEEKLAGRNLTVVTTLPEEEAYVYADGRHLWRVIDNLLGNCCKYALEGTRIYLDLKRGKGQIVLSVKNISRDALNVPAEQLMERFVRGDASRTTEGSGLGLSIARSLTELQGGTFELAVDGDLFKAIVTMPQAG